MKPSRLISFALIIALSSFVLGLRLAGSSQQSPEPAHQTHEQEPQSEQIWTCSMHPQIRLPKAGKCPICHMDLVPAAAADEGDESPTEGSLKLSPRAKALARVESRPAQMGRAVRSLRLYGQVAVDDSRQARIAAWVDGRIERVYVDQAGVPVRRGQPLLKLYSPQLLASQEELLGSKKAAAAYAPSDKGPMARAARRMFEASRKRLRLWGMSEIQLDGLLKSGQAEDLVTIRSPMSGVVLERHGLPGAYVKTGQVLYNIADLSRVWVWIEAYEEDLPWIQLGQKVRILTPALPGREIEGAIALLDPVMNAPSRVLRLRVELDNRDFALRPGMQVTGLLLAELPEAQVLVPDSAVLSTGKRHIVYVEQEGAYRLRHVQPGPLADGQRVILSGLKPGEQVVTEGIFQIDAAMQIRAWPSLMSPQAEAEEEAPESFRKNFKPALVAYLDLQQALADDDAQASSQAAKQMDPSLAKLQSAEQEKIGAELAKMKQAAKTIAGTRALEFQRRAFQTLSDGWLKILRHHGGPAKLSLFEHHCPMAFNNQGAWWLDDSLKVTNPYFGESMLRCADVSRPLGSRPSPPSKAQQGHQHHGSPS
ncbi:MAG: efflux RND transporter periplasmic adaptor subunit [Deltaproteobacteria bacterium]|nr:efflux RND transporter periplasmic adaptor subunit [Deltaproteobacteria bacterium]